ncbi:MAG: DUF3047 domain-containing protein [Candidatus Omnitrophica bacterium]|nr:DUF3047 domain-containing protein [Candidatus Omnitrophota bacterium]
MRKRKFIYVAILTSSILFICYAHALDLPKRFLFNKENALEEWQEKVFKNKVMYTVQSEEEALLAKSEEGCSGLFYRIGFSPKEFPMISWQWQVVEFPEKAAGETGPFDEKTGWIERDDYAARVYVIFPSLNFSKTRCIEYIWDENLPEGTVMTSPYFKNIKLIVAESGRGNMEKWVLEEYNIYEDYIKVFGEAPRRNVGAIALMTDTDNTLSTAEALYKNIKVGYKNE